MGKLSQKSRREKKKAKPEGNHLEEAREKKNGEGKGNVADSQATCSKGNVFKNAKPETSCPSPALDAIVLAHKHGIVKDVGDAAVKDLVTMVFETYPKCMLGNEYKTINQVIQARSRSFDELSAAIKLYMQPYS